jgi:hypothetical protein
MAGLVTPSPLEEENEKQAFRYGKHMHHATKQNRYIYDLKQATQVAAGTSYPACSRVILLVESRNDPIAHSLLSGEMQEKRTRSIGSVSQLSTHRVLTSLSVAL